MSLHRPSLEESRRRERPIKRCHMCGARVFCPNCRDHRQSPSPSATGGQGMTRLCEHCGSPLPTHTQRDANLRLAHPSH
jgi:hypothetical protein